MFKHWLQWFWKQKYRVDRGYQLVSLINMVLLLTQSQKLANFLSLNTSTFVIIAIPTIFMSVWFCGYLISKPMVQLAEDRANAEVSQLRRDIDEILRLLKRNNNVTN